MNKKDKPVKGYAIAVNSDRVHISLDSVPVETFLFSSFAIDKDDDGKQLAIGVAVCKALEINNGTILVNIK